ncbi:hypothetical protein BH23GEM6_BH23GEM6_21510 [soil metagenome]
MFARLILFAALALTTGCNSVLGLGERQVVAVIDGFGTDAPAIEVPSVVQAGNDLSVTINTTWGDGCARQGPTEIRSDGATRTITPYTIIIERQLCTMEARQFTHTAVLRFDEPGPARVIVRSRAYPSGEVSSMQRAITVQ